MLGAGHSLLPLPPLCIFGPASLPHLLEVAVLLGPPRLAIFGDALGLEAAVRGATALQRPFPAEASNLLPLLREMLCSSSPRIFSPRGSP